MADFGAAPRRAVRLTMEVDADTRADLASYLINMAHKIERGLVTRGVSGSPSSGAIYELLEDPTQTHDAYFAQVRAYLAKKDADHTAAQPNNEPKGGT